MRMYYSIFNLYKEGTTDARMSEKNVIIVALSINIS